MKFKRETLLEMDLPWNALEETFVEQSRWETLWEIIFEHEGKHYSTTYRAGSTENQETDPWEYEKEVECTEVELKEVTVKKWVPVASAVA